MTNSPLLNAFNQNNAAFLTYTVGGDPNKETSLEIFREIARSGADIIECGPEFSEAQVKAMAAAFEVKGAPDEYGDVVMRPAILSDKFVSPYENEQQGRAANGGAYPPDLSVMVKARHGGADYVYSLLLGYEDAPEGMVLDDGVYYNIYAKGQKIAMPQLLSADAVEYSDGTAATPEQMARDVTMFLTWTAEPKLEARKRIGFKVITYLLILSFLLYFTNKQIWKESH